MITIVSERNQLFQEGKFKLKTTKEKVVSTPYRTLKDLTSFVATYSLLNTKQVNFMFSLLKRFAVHLEFQQELFQLK